MPPVPIRSQRKPKGLGPERREEILASALKLFSEFGVHTVSTRQIAAAVGISQPSLYAYFPTKLALIEEVSARAFVALTESTRAVSHDLRGAERILALGRVYIQFGLQQPEAYRVAFMMESEVGAAEGASPMLVAGLVSFNMHRQAVAEEFGAGLSPHAIDLLAQSLWASLHGLVSLMIARPGFPWVDRQELIDFHLQRIVENLKPASA